MPTTMERQAKLTRAEAGRMLYDETISVAEAVERTGLTTANLYQAKHEERKRQRGMNPPSPPSKAKLVQKKKAVKAVKSEPAAATEPVVATPAAASETESSRITHAFDAWEKLDNDRRHIIELVRMTAGLPRGEEYHIEEILDSFLEKKRMALRGRLRNSIQSIVDDSRGSPSA